MEKFKSKFEAKISFMMENNGQENEFDSELEIGD